MESKDGIEDLIYKAEIQTQMQRKKYMDNKKGKQGGGGALGNWDCYIHY